MNEPAAGDAVDALFAAGTEPHVLAVIWATVDTERVLAGIGLEAIQLPDDPLLGATVRLVRPSHGEPIALLEPRTEGRLSEWLARTGEGPARRYVVAPGGLVEASTRAAAAGIVLSRIADGPFGRSVLVGRAAAGPQVVLVDRPAGTIDP